MVLWKAASTRRVDMGGLTDGIDRAATNAAWRRTGGYVGGILRGIIAGAIWTQDRLFRGVRIVVQVLLRTCHTCGVNALPGMLFALATQQSCLRIDRHDPHAFPSAG